MCVCVYIHIWKWKLLSCVQLFATPWTHSTVHGIPQARILEWVAFSFYRGSSWMWLKFRGPTIIAIGENWSGGRLAISAILMNPFPLDLMDINIKSRLSFSTFGRDGFWPLESVLPLCGNQWSLRCGCLAKDCNCLSFFAAGFGQATTSPWDVRGWGVGPPKLRVLSECESPDSYSSQTVWTQKGSSRL